MQLQHLWQRREIFNTAVFLQFVVVFINIVIVYIVAVSIEEMIRVVVGLFTFLALTSKGYKVVKRTLKIITQDAMISVIQNVDKSVVSDMCWCDSAACSKHFTEQTQATFRQSFHATGIPLIGAHMKML